LSSKPARAGRTLLSDAVEAQTDNGTCSAQIHQQLNMYALAATAAGVGAPALATPALVSQNL